MPAYDITAQTDSLPDSRPASKYRVEDVRHSQCLLPVTEESIQRVDSHNDIQPTTAQTLAAEHGVSSPTINRDGKLARMVEELKQNVPDIEQQVMSGEAACNDYSTARGGR